MIFYESVEKEKTTNFYREKRESRKLGFICNFL